MQMSISHAPSSAASCFCTPVVPKRQVQVFLLGVAQSCIAVLVLLLCNRFTQASRCSIGAKASASSVIILLYMAEHQVRHWHYHAAWNFSWSGSLCLQVAEKTVDPRRRESAVVKLGDCSPYVRTCTYRICMWPCKLGNASRTALC